jgi:hypothetical protein
MMVRMGRVMEVFCHPLINIISGVCCVIDQIPVPIYLYTQQGWHISEHSTSA